MPKTVDLEMQLQPEALAVQVSEQWVKWAKEKKEQEWTECRNYVFATDTTTTTNSKLPWKNKTTRPKLCQIRDNLHANYMAALFPNERWFKWDPRTKDAADKEKAKAVQAYLASKMRDSGFKEIISRLVYDYIDYGNCFAEVEYVDDPTGPFSGPRPVRISPIDIRFDLTAPSFMQTPKIVRTLISIGDLMAGMATDPVYSTYKPEVIQKILDNRRAMNGAVMNSADAAKSRGFTADGFGDINAYYSSGMVEVLEFEGDIYDQETNKVYPKHQITVLDRCYVAASKPLQTLTGRSVRHHCGWRLRPDNLMAMGPLDNLVGLQYRIDHLENLRADVFDLIAHPPLKVQGTVEDFVYGPHERIFMPEGSDVAFLTPDTTALQADFQIRELEFLMEEMAGAPREAAGFRTPGEKTAFEVSALQSAANRIFISKISYFEEHFLEPILNSMLELGRVNVNASEMVSMPDKDYSITNFLKVNKDDLKAKGKIVPLGARHFAAQAQLIQNLTGFASTGLYADPAVSAHFSGLKIAQLVEENLGLQDYGLVSPNIRVSEQAQTQKLVNSAQDNVQAEALTPAPGEITDESAEPSDDEPAFPA